MDFYSVLSTGAEIEFVTEEFAMAFLKAVTSDPENWVTRVSHRFVGQCFRVLGLRFNVAEEDSFWTQDHSYRTDNPNYIFNPDLKLMDDVQAFFKELPLLLSHYASALKLDVENCRFDRLTHPVSAYLRVVIVWMKVVHSISGSMQLTSVTSADRFLCEPLARMSFYILNGLVILLPKYAHFDGLKEICLSLAVDVRYGIFYQATCEVVLRPMLDMFEVYYKTFCGVEKSALDFVFCILTVQMDEANSYIEAYEFLEIMIEQFAKSMERDQDNHLYLRLFTNELITDKYMAVIFETLKTSNSKRLLMTALKYLMTLQKHLVTAECFTIRFHEILLQLILRAPLSFSLVSSMAAKVYVKLSQRKYQEGDISLHILETYIKSQGNPRKNPSYAQFRNELGRYLKIIATHFPALHRFETYSIVLSARDVRIELSLIAAQSVSILFERLMAEYLKIPEACEQINIFLHWWPDLVRSASHQTGTRAILYSIYGMVDFVAVAQIEKELLLILEQFCLDNFLTDNTLSESEFQGLYSNIYLSVNATGNDLIYTSAENYIREEQAQLMALLNENDTEDSQMVELLETYANSLRRLHSLLIVKKFDVRHVVDIYPTLVKLLLEQRVQNKSLICYGSESLATMLVMLYVARDKSDNDFCVRILLLVHQLLDFCKSELSNSNLDFVRAKFLFCSILILHIGNLPDLSLDDATYGTLLDWLLQPPRDSDPELLVEGYVSEMHFVFRRLLQSKHLVLPNNRIWKVLVQYKMTSTALKYLDFELEQLLGVLLEHRVQGYIHCLPVILLHVTGDKNNSKTRVSSLLTAHLSIIERHVTVFDSWLLRLIVFQELLLLLVKNMGVRRLEVTSSRQRNRLLPLRSVLPLLTALRLQENHFMIIAKSIHSLKEEAMGPEETMEIENFITEISKFKYQCEDEHLSVQNIENFDGKLTSLPPGPLSYWQYEAIKDLQDG
ncbi:uncharacterized protein LOC110178892 [Drosophila serrata]|uniref:uncharacterized protein LOC110178892 n=1 Tax=Drosophila serrata TaxID=7274 RepID=UPI000A1D367D|nr:uncharacterized protein LOC110178892 [Drosophila serrata]